MPPDALLPEKVDGRGLAARTYRAGLRELYADLGGEAHLSFVEKALGRRAMALELWLGSVDARALRGDDITSLMGVYAQSTNTLLGIYRLLGLKRRTKPVPSLQEYLAQRYGSDTPEDAGDE